MNQQELDKAIALHQLYLEGILEGAILELSHSNLSYSNLSRLELSCSGLSNTDLSNVDLSHSDLSCSDISNANLSHSNLSNANISHSDLSKCNLTNTKGLPKAPHIDNIDRQLFAILQDKNNALNMCRWDICGTTHCRGGWYIQLAGEKGRKLAKEQGSAVAASLIFHESYPDKIIPNWFCSDSEAMEDIKRNA